MVFLFFFFFLQNMRSINIAINMMNTEIPQLINAHCNDDNPDELPLSDDGGAGGDGGTGGDGGAGAFLKISNYE